MATNNGCDYSPTQYNVQSGGASGSLNDIAPSTAGFVLTSNGASAQPTFQIPPINGTLTYYLTNTASAVASNLQLTPAPYTPKTTISFTGVTNAQELQDWITNAGVPNIAFIPAGVFNIHLHALQVATAGHKNASLYAEFWEAGSTGTDIAKIGTTETSSNLTTSEAEYTLAFTTTNTYTMGSTASRIKIKLFATVAGAGAAPDVNIFVGGTADSHIDLPSQTVDATNFVPYTGATADVNLGTHNITANSATLTSALTVPNGGSGAATLTGILKGNGASAFTALTFADGQTWTPALAFGGGSTGITYANQKGWYTQIGNAIIAVGFIDLTNKGSSTGAATVTLPVASGLSGGFTNLSVALYRNIGFPTGYFTMGLILNGLAASARIFVCGPGGAVNYVALDNTNFTNTSTISFNGVYFAD